MDFKSPLFVFIVMSVAMLGIVIYTVIIQVQLMNTSKMLLELANKVSKLSDDTSRNASELSTDMYHVSKEVWKLSNDMSRDVFQVSRKTWELSENFSHFSNYFLETFGNFKMNVSSTFERYHAIEHVKNPSGLYSFGGATSNGVSASASHWNNSTGRWEKIKNMSTRKKQMCGAVIGEKVYLFGGWLSSDETSQAEVYDSLTGNYKELHSMPETRHECGAAVLKGSIYVAGGHTSLKSVIRYNIQTDQWTTVKSMNIGRYAFQLVSLNGNLYAIGGVRKNTVEVYDATADEWSMGEDTHYSHRHFGAAVHEGKIYVCSHLGFEVYSPDTKKWRVLAPLNGDEGRTLVSMNGKLWALGGDESKSVHTYDTLAGKWAQQEDMLVARKDHVSFVVNP